MQRIIAFDTTFGESNHIFKLKKGDIIDVEPPDIYARQYATIQNTRIYTYTTLIERISNPINTVPN